LNTHDLLLYYSPDLGECCVAQRTIGATPNLAALGSASEWFHDGPSCALIIPLFAI
jgi:hypothetical protein